MALNPITAVLIYDASDFLLTAPAEIQKTSGSNDLLEDAAVYPSVHETLSEAAELTMQVFSASEWIANRLLRNRHRMVVQFANGDEQYFRVDRIEINASGELASRVRATEIWTDLFSTTFQWVLAPGERPRYWQPLVRQSALDALTKVFTLGYGIPETEAGSGTAAFALGTVEATVQTVQVTLDANASSHGELVQSICEQVADKIGSCEFEVRKDFSSGQIILDFWEQIGLTATERSSGIDATRRPVSDKEGNRVRARISDTSEDYFSRVVPFAGPPDERIGIDGVRWDIIGCVLGGGTTTLTLSTHATGDSPIWEDGALVGLKIKAHRADGSVSYRTINSTTAPNIVEVTTVGGDELCVNPVAVSVEFMALDEGGLTAAGEGVSLSYLPDVTLEAPGGPGRSDRVLDFRDHPAYENLLEGANIVSDMRGTPVNWAPGVDLPVGWQPWPTGAHLLPALSAGAMRSSIVTDDEFTVFGDQSVFVQSYPFGSGIRSTNISLVPADPLLPYVSFSAVIRVANLSMQVRVFLVDADGVEWPAFTQLVARNTFYTEFKANGFAPAAGQGYLVISGVQGFTLPPPTVSYLSTDFYVDAAAVSFASVAPNYAEEMGPRFLWAKAARILKDLGGLQDPEFETDFYSFDEFDAGPYDPVTIGSHCSLSELWDPATDTHLFSQDARAVEITREYHETHPTQVTARFARRRLRVTDIIAQLTRDVRVRPPESGISEIIGGADPGTPVCLDAAEARDPLVTDDSTAGYCINSMWTNTADDTMWWCVDDTPGAAIWLNPKTGEVVGPPGTPGTPGAPGRDGTGVGDLTRIGGFVDLAAGLTTVQVSRVDDFSNIVPEGHIRVYPATALPPARQWFVPNEKIRGSVFSIDLDAAEAAQHTFGWCVDWPRTLGDKAPNCSRAGLVDDALLLNLVMDELAGQVAHDHTVGGWNAIASNSIVVAATDPVFDTKGLTFDRTASQYSQIDESTDRFGTGPLPQPRPLAATTFFGLLVGCTVHSEPAHAFKHWVIARGSDSGSNLNWSLYFEDDGVDTFLRTKVHGTLGGPDIASYQLNPTYAHGDFIVAAARLTSAALELYVNGVLVASASNTVGLSTNVQDGVVLGNTQDLAANEYYTGTIFYVRVHNRLLTPAEVTAESDYINCVAQYRDTTIVLTDDLDGAAEHGLYVPSGATFS